MTPFYFGTPKRRLFGVYAPAVAGSGRKSAVLCNPFGREYLRAHRSIRQLATLLAGAGFHVLRFDYFGTGDSAGDLPEADPEGWQADIVTAIEELRDTCDVPRVMLGGVRLGGLLAARVAAARPRDVEALMLWDPVVSGAAYLAELLDDTVDSQEAYLLPVARPAERGGGHEVAGFVLTERFAAGLSALEWPVPPAALPARTFVMTSRPETEGSLRSFGRFAENAVETARAEEPLPWEGPGDGPGAMPVRTLRQLVEWAA